MQSLLTVGTSAGGRQPKAIIAINGHLVSWGLVECNKETVSFEIDGKWYSDVRIEQTYKGNYHLYATEDGRERKFVIGKNKPEYGLIASTGIACLAEKTLMEMAWKYLR